MLTLLTFFLTNLGKSTALWCMVSFWYELLCNVLIYTSKTDQWITMWWPKLQLEYLLLLSIYFNLKFKVTCKNGDFECRYTITHSVEKRQIFLTLHSPFCIFRIKMFKISYHPEHFWIYFFDETFRFASGLKQRKNVEFVNF